MNKVFAIILVIMVAAGLSGCRTIKWSYCVNSIYANEYVDLGNGQHVESQRGNDGWIIVDVSVTNITGRTQCLDNYNEQFLLIVGEEGTIYDNAAFPESEYGIPWDMPIESGATIRAEVYFDASPSYLESDAIGFFMMESIFVEPMGVAIDGSSLEPALHSDAAGRNEEER